MCASLQGLDQQLQACLCQVLSGCHTIPTDHDGLVHAVRAKYMRDYCHKRYQNDSGYRAAAILKASARVQQRRQDPSYRAREAELQRVRRARQRDANVTQMRKG